MRQFPACSLHRGAAATTTVYCATLSSVSRVRCIRGSREAELVDGHPTHDSSHCNTRREGCPGGAVQSLFQLVQDRLGYFAHSGWVADLLRLSPACGASRICTCPDRPQTTSSVAQNRNSPRLWRHPQYSSHCRCMSTPFEACSRKPTFQEPHAHHIRRTRVTNTGSGCLCDGCFAGQCCNHTLFASSPVLYVHSIHSVHHSVHSLPRYRGINGGIRSTHW